ncbi:MAG: hypothetical protein HC922_07520 [Leptolyngbyaceae cyanobacterium SM2_3_12]|nr:hypothetical protein [Leptolyngbyaceae cyanobacterium SM2_3_12]
MPAEYAVTEQDALQYSRHCMVGTGLLIGGYGATVAGFISPLALFFLVALVLPRWMINVHELLHIYDEKQLNRFICLMGVSPVPLSVLSLSYGEIRTLHFAHHRAPATEADPDFYHIQGSWPRAIFNAFTAPEQSTWHWIAHHGLTWQLGLDLAIKLGVLGYLAWVGGPVFLWFWLSLRLMYGLGDLAFFRWVHHNQGNYGTFGRPLPQALVQLGTLVFGTTVIQATLNHDLHHHYPYLAARHLSVARDICRQGNGPD